MHKHVEDNSVTYILLINKELCIKVGKLNNSKLSTCFEHVVLIIRRDELYIINYIYMYYIYFKL